MVDPITNTYPVFYGEHKLTTFYYPKEKVIDPNFDIKENLKLFYNKGNGLVRVQLGGQSFAFASQQIVGNNKNIQIYEEVYEDEEYKDKTTNLLKEIKLPNSLNNWEEIN